MTNPPSPTSTGDRSRRGLHRISFGCFTMLGLATASGPAWAGPEGSATADVGWVLLGLAVLTVPLITWTRFLARPRPEKAVTARGEVIEIRLRTATPAATAVLGVVWAALAAWAAYAGSLSGAGLFAVPFVLLFAAIVPDSVRAATRRPHLLIDPDGVRLRGWSLDGALAFDDMIAVDVVSVRPQRPVIRLLTTTGARSLSRTRHRYLVQVDLKTDEPALDVPLVALDSPDRTAAFLSILRGLPREERWLQLAGPGVAFLNGDVQPAT